LQCNTDLLSEIEKLSLKSKLAIEVLGGFIKSTLIGDYTNLKNNYPSLNEKYLFGNTEFDGIQLIGILAELCLREDRFIKQEGQIDNPKKVLESSYSCIPLYLARIHLQLFIEISPNIGIADIERKKEGFALTGPNLEVLFSMANRPSTIATGCPALPVAAIEHIRNLFLDLIKIWQE